MANEEITTPKPPWGGESGSRGGAPIQTQRSILGGTLIRRRPIAPRCRPQPIKLELAQDTNILANPGW